MLSSTASTAYPSPPFLRRERSSLPRIHKTMGDTGSADVDGVGRLTYQSAIDTARTTEGDLDPKVHSYLEEALEDIWGRINSAPESYILSKDEFAIFNFYIQRFDGQPAAESAIERYWRHTSELGPGPQ